MADGDSNVEEVLKVLLIGDSGVGKSSFLTMYCDDTFAPVFNQTVGIDFKKKTIERNGKTVVLQIWDTAGQERYLSMTRAYYRGANAFVLMFDLTNIDSLKNCQNWMATIQDMVTVDYKSTVVVLVGNKGDLLEDCVVSHDDIKEFTTKFDIKYFETSSKDNMNLKEVFECIIDASIKETPIESPVESPVVNPTVGTDHQVIQLTEENNNMPKSIEPNQNCYC